MQAIAFYHSPISKSQAWTALHKALFKCSLHVRQRHIHTITLLCVCVCTWEHFNSAVEGWKHAVEPYAGFYDRHSGIIRPVCFQCDAAGSKTANAGAYETLDAGDTILLVRQAIRCRVDVTEAVDDLGTRHQSPTSTSKPNSGALSEIKICRSQLAFIVKAHFFC